MRRLSRREWARASAHAPPTPSEAWQRARGLRALVRPPQRTLTQTAEGAPPSSSCSPCVRHPRMRSLRRFQPASLSKPTASFSSAHAALRLLHRIASHALSGATCAAVERRQKRDAGRAAQEAYAWHHHGCQKECKRWLAHLIAAIAWRPGGGESQNVNVQQAHAQVTRTATLFPCGLFDPLVAAEAAVRCGIQQALLPVQATTSSEERVCWHRKRKPLYSLLAAQPRR